LLEAAVVFKPETLVRWHRSGFRLYWRCKYPTHASQAPASDLRALLLSREKDVGFLGRNQPLLTITA
jgi:hypothetical protein